MSKKKKNVETVYHVSSVENTLRNMPKFNAFAGGYGAYSKNEKHPSRHQRKAKDRKLFKNYL